MDRRRPTSEVSQLKRLAEWVILALEFLVVTVRILLYMLQSLFQTIFPRAKKSLVGQVVLVTGAGHGIGRELALQFSDIGAIVVCVDINDQGNAETVKEITESGNKAAAYAYRCDVSNREDVIAMVRRVNQEVGFIDVLVNNAGIMPTRPLLQQTPEEIRRTFDINIMAHVWVLQAVLPDMVRRGRGHVTAISSLCGEVGMPNLAPYCATKFAVRGLMETMALELPQLRFTTICPFMVNTGLVKGYEVRFPGLLSPLEPRLVASETVEAVQRETVLKSIPSWMFNVSSITRLIPIPARVVLQEFFKVEILDK